MSPRTLTAHDRRLVAQLPDRRGRRVIFLSHCLLNENSRYLGGACRVGCVRELVDECLNAGLGIVQLPCPEQCAWGGVLKRRLLSAYGLRERHPLLYRLRRMLLLAGMAYTTFVYRRLARRAADDIADYVGSGFRVVGIVGVDGSPSCGVRTTIDPAALQALAALAVRCITPQTQRAILEQFAMPGSGQFIAQLHRALGRRRISVPLLAHDLLAEARGQRSTVHIA